VSVSKRAMLLELSRSTLASVSSNRTMVIRHHCLPGEEGDGPTHLEKL
jgi:hypothetical protein